MEFNTDVVSQVILLAGLLGGFSLTTTAQIALNTEATPQQRRITNSLLLGFTACLVIIVLGIANLSTPDMDLKKALAVVMVYFGGLVIAHFIR